MFPFLFGFFLIVMQSLDVAPPFELCLPFAFSAIAAFVVWVAIWRREVHWSLRVALQTSGSFLLLVGLPIAAQAVFLVQGNDLIDTLVMCLPILGWGLWMPWTIRIWPMKPEALAVDPMGPRCMKCAYSLRGLRATRCPECGDEPTLDELWVGALSP